MPVTETSRPCQNLEADAYILIHDNTSATDFRNRRVFNRASPEVRQAYENSGILPYGDPVITRAYGLKAKYVIHILQSKDKPEKDRTRLQYMKALKLAQNFHCESVGFCLPTHDYDEAQSVFSVCCAFARESDMLIYLSGTGDNYWGLSFGLMRELEKYLGIDREQADWEEFQRAIALVNSPYEEDEPEADCDQCAFFPDTGNDRKPPAAPEMSCDEGLPEVTDTGFRDLILEHMDRTGRKESEVYRRANMSRSSFRDIMGAEVHIPSKSAALALAIALELSRKETEDLIGRAGYALSQKSTSDRIVSFFIRKKMYDIHRINSALFYFQKNQLGE